MLAKRFNQSGKVIILSETTDEPLTLAGSMAGICWNSNVADPQKNFARGVDCLNSGHGRILEFPQIYMVLDGWSARVIREFYTHIGGAPTRLQASTRYIDYSDFNYVTPPSIKNNENAFAAYTDLMQYIQNTAEYLEKDLGLKREDCGMVLPLAMKTKVVVRTNLRNLIDMAKTRLCSRAYWEFQQLFKEIAESLSIYSDEWKVLVEDLRIFRPKCEWQGYCNERNSCHKMPNEEEYKELCSLIKKVRDERRTE